MWGGLTLNLEQGRYVICEFPPECNMIINKKTFLQEDQATHSVTGRKMGHRVQRNAWHPTAIRHIIHLMHQSSKMIKCPNPTMFNILN